MPAHTECIGPVVDTVLFHAVPVVHLMASSDTLELAELPTLKVFETKKKTDDLYQPPCSKKRTSFQQFKFSRFHSHHVMQYKVAHQFSPKNTSAIAIRCCCVVRLISL